MGIVLTVTPIPAVYAPGSILTSLQAMFAGKTGLTTANVRRLTHTMDASTAAYRKAFRRSAVIGTLLLIPFAAKFHPSRLGNVLFDENFLHFRPVGGASWRDFQTPLPRQDLHRLIAWNRFSFGKALISVAHIIAF